MTLLAPGAPWVLKKNFLSCQLPSRERTQQSQKVSWRSGEWFSQLLRTCTHTYRPTETYFDFYKYRYSEIKRHKGGPGLFGARCQFQKSFHFNSIASGLSRSLKCERKNILAIWKNTFGAPGPKEIDMKSSETLSILIWATKFLYTKFG